MILTTTFKSKGRGHSLSLDTEKADRNEADENYAEWLVKTENWRVILITVWKDALGRFTDDGTAEVYRDMGDYRDGMLLDKKNIKLKQEQKSYEDYYQKQEQRDSGEQYHLKGGDGMDCA